MGKELNSWIVAIARPPLLVLRFVVTNLYSLMFGWWLDERLARRSNQKLEDQIRKYLRFVFADHHARVIPNDREPTAILDLALVTVAVDDLILRFLKERGSIVVSIAPARDPGDRHDLSTVLNVLDPGVPRQGFSHLLDVERVLRFHLEDLKRAFSVDQIAELKRLLADTYGHDRIAIRQWETEINRRL